MLKRLLGLVLAGSVGSAMAAQHFSTMNCAKYGQPEFVFSVDDGALGEQDALWLRSTLEGMVAAGQRFKSGETLLLGPVVLKLEATEGGQLRVLEPDMKSMPFKYVPSVAKTLRIVRLQRYAADSLGVTDAMRFAPLHLPLLVTRNALQAPRILMMRSNSAGSGTGWVLSDAQDRNIANGDLQAMSVYEAALKRPEIMDFLALPEQFSIVVASRKKFEIFKDGEPIKPLEGSYLAQLAK